MSRVKKSAPAEGADAVDVPVERARDPRVVTLVVPPPSYAPLPRGPRMPS